MSNPGDVQKIRYATYQKKKKKSGGLGLSIYICVISTEVVIRNGVPEEHIGPRQYS